MQEGIPLAGGWCKGDEVVSKIAHEKVAIGNKGIVEGPALNTGIADAAQRINVDFGDGKGVMDMIAASQIEGSPLAGGWVKFDVVLSRIEHNGIEMGDQGVIMGPSNNSKAQDASERVNVDFGVGKGRVNMLASSQIEGVSLAGGLVRGDSVVSKVAHLKVKILEQGVVLGPSTKPSAEDAAERVCVDFGAKGIFNMQVFTQVQGIPLAGGWMKGDKVRSKIKHGGVDEGDEGTVVGPSSNAAAEDADQRVCIAFGKERKRINMLVATQIEGAPLAGGWLKGDQVISTIKHKEVEVGQEGVVMGPSLRAFAEDANERVCVDFGEKGGCVNMLAEAHIKGLTLAGGWTKGDRVVSKIKHNSLQVGEEGVVKGPSSNPKAPDAASRVCVYFGKENGQINMLATMQIRGIKLSGSWVKGDVVVSKIKHKDVEVGDKGTVVGPSTNPKATDADNRVCVDFGPRGSLNLLSQTQIELPLPGGWAKGDKVACKIVPDGARGVEVGDPGTIVGQVVPDGQGVVGRQVRVDFGDQKGVFGMDAFSDLTRSGEKKGDATPKSDREKQAEVAKTRAESEVDVRNYNNNIVQGPCLAAAYGVVTEESVKELFTASSSRSYRATRVELVPRKDSLVKKCSDMLDDLDNRRSGALAGIFSATLPEDIEDGDRRAKAKLTSFLQRFTMTTEWAGPGSRFSHVLPVWHGDKEDAIKAVAQKGFGSMPATPGDPGRFGIGKYNALQAELACLNSSKYPQPKPKNANGEWVVLLSAAVVGLAYPVTPGEVDFPKQSLPPSDMTTCKHHGQPFKPPSDTHVVGIDGPSRLCVAPEQAKYHELVSSKDAQLLPLALVYFSEN